MGETQEPPRQTFNISGMVRRNDSVRTMSESSISFKPLPGDL